MPPVTLPVCIHVSQMFGWQPSCFVFRWTSNSSFQSWYGGTDVLNENGKVQTGGGEMAFVDELLDFSLYNIPRNQ